MKYAGDYNIEEAYNGDTDKWDARKIKTICPHCKKEMAPLCSNKTKEKDSGWRWCADICQEPYSKYETECRHCKGKYAFDVHVPQ